MFSSVFYKFGADLCKSLQRTFFIECFLNIDQKKQFSEFRHTLDTIASNQLFPHEPCTAFLPRRGFSYNPHIRALKIRDDIAKPDINYFQNQSLLIALSILVDIRFFRIFYRRQERNEPL